MAQLVSDAVHELRPRSGSGREPVGFKPRGVVQRIAREQIRHGGVRPWLQAGEPIGDREQLAPLDARVVGYDAATSVCRGGADLVSAQRQASELDERRRAVLDGLCRHLEAVARIRGLTQAHCAQAVVVIRPGIDVSTLSASRADCHALP